MKTTIGFAVFLVAFLLAGAAAAQQVFVFPAQGQTPQQQAQDEGTCNAWAVNQTGFNPMHASTAPPPPGEAPRGGLLRGGAMGAATGAAVGAITGNTGRGAAAGAAGGALIGGMLRNDQRNQQAAEAQTWQQHQNANRDAWLRAYTACLEGKGYTVN
jgi:Glycine zipper